MHESNDRRNLITLANAIELITASSMEVLGNSKTSKTMQGQKMSKQTIADAATAQVRARLTTILGG